LAFIKYSCGPLWLDLPFSLVTKLILILVGIKIRHDDGNKGLIRKESPHVLGVSIDYTIVVLDESKVKGQTQQIMNLGVFRAYSGVACLMLLFNLKKWAFRMRSLRLILYKWYSIIKLFFG